MDPLKKPPYSFSEQDIIADMKTHGENGLSNQEASRRLEEFGPNAIESGKKVSAWKILLANLNNIIVYLLVVAAAVAFIMGDTVEGIAVIVAILIAVFSGFISEFKAQKSVEALQNMVKTIAKVIRDGSIREVESTELVPGDLVFIEEGDSITIDGRIIRSTNLATNESALTGESEPVEKESHIIEESEVSIGDRTNMVHAATAATRGNAYVIVTGTGMKTEIGRISDMLDQQEESDTPLEEQLDRLGKTLIIISAAVAFVVTIAGIITGKEIYEMIKIGIILAIAAVPEALPAVSTITLALGMRIMARHHALVKNLPAVETLGSTTVICTDKTGTLTENQMTVTQVYLADKAFYSVEGNGYEPKGTLYQEGTEINPTEHDNLLAFTRAGVLSSNATLVTDGDYSVIGDPTEGALIVLGRKLSIDRDSIEEDNYRRIGEIPFDSKAKYMATAYTHSQGKSIYIKGAPDVLAELSKCSPGIAKDLEQANDGFASEGMRVLAIGHLADYRGDGSESSMRKALGEGFELLGLAGIIDPPRNDVKQAISEARQAGIRVIMITGDHPKTAKIIASQIGMDIEGEVITGKEMDNMSEKELTQRIRNTSIFARVSPENKLQIVHALKAEHEITAMTGDGVNDAPALNGADIGVAMGIRGTEVAKEASDMILTDDRFSTIVDAVREGRIIFDNIEKFVYFLFSCNFIEIFVVFIAIVLGLPMPILALQILWLNLVVDVLPAMSLAWEPGENGVMKRKPRNPKQAIVTRSFLVRVLGNGALMSVGAMVVFILGIRSGLQEDTVRTMAFTTMALGQIAHIFNVREKDSFGFDKGIFRNRFLVMALVISLGLQIMAIYLPFLNHVLETTPLSGIQWFEVLAGALIPMALIQLWRVFSTKHAKGEIHA
ncbi:cation-translocating P-type ATPase [Pleomorphochaeta sp. DL1XJH-081]|uniref:cation-translocating P-type ATPase n=1 Tax=Pleomorphochaeta sp. DL1XJH-081 TaxID=3409690 RepID=UPI003BB6DA04